MVAVEHGPGEVSVEGAQIARGEVVRAVSHGASKVVNPAKG